MHLPRAVRRAAVPARPASLPAPLLLRAASVRPACSWEWREGFATRFGLVRIDFDKPNLPRRPKDSARWMAQNVFRVSNLK